MKRDKDASCMWGGEAFDLHIHSSFSSDGMSEPSDIVKTAVKLGLGGIAVVDHNSLRGGERAMECAPPDFIVLKGMEISSSSGHIIALGLDKPVEAGLSPMETVERIIDEGGFPLAPHPYRFWSGLGVDNARSSGFKAVEVMNARSNKGHNNLARKLANELGVGMTGGSDAHDLVHIGAAVTIFPQAPSTIDEAMGYIEKGLTDGRGSNRSAIDTINYVTKSVSEWMGRGMKRM